MEIVLTILLTIIVYGMINFLGQRHANKEKKKILDDFVAKQEIIKQERLEKYGAIAEKPLHDFYTSISDSWKKPETAMYADLLIYASEQEIQKAQIMQPDNWFNWKKECFCWKSDDTLYILQTLPSIESNAKESPDLYSTEDRISKQVSHIAIPLGNIHHFIQKGQLTRSTRTVVNGGVSYTGVNVNGIGFGEVTHTPSIDVPDIKDSRYIILYYRVSGKNELQTLYFGADSLDTLIRIIPEYER